MEYPREWIAAKWINEAWGNIEIPTAEEEVAEEAEHRADCERRDREDPGWRQRAGIGRILKRLRDRIAEK